MRKKSGGDGGDVCVVEGSLVLSKYQVDQAVYRARVEEIVVGKNGEEDMFRYVPSAPCHEYCNKTPRVSVRYIDYGNRGERLTHADIYTWDSLLEKIPPQAVSCTLFRVPDITPFTRNHEVAFTSLMKESSPLKMTVHQRLTSENITELGTGPDVVVSLRSKDGKDLLTKLSSIQIFKSFFIMTDYHDETTADFSLSASNIDKLDHLKPLPPFRVPPPLHLDGEVLAQVCEDEPTSPLHSEFTRKAVEKVHWWLNRTDTEDQKPGGELGRKKEIMDLSSMEPEFLETLNMKNRAEKLNEARKQLYEDDSSILSGSMPVTSRAVKASKPSQTVFPSVDMRVGRTYTPPHLAMQDVQVSSAEFSFVLSLFPFSFSLMTMVNSIVWCPSLSVQKSSTCTPFKSPVDT